MVGGLGGIIFETHGDACRLGYLKLVACLLEDGAPRSPDYLASILLEMCKSLDNDVEEGMHGVLRSEVNARNYVKLASQLGFYDRKTGLLGEFGAAYISIGPSDVLKHHIGGDRRAKLPEVLFPTKVESLLFLHAVLRNDYYLAAPLIRWIFKNRDFSRQQAMENVMEEIYPEALRRAMKITSGRMRQDLATELEEALKFRETRMLYRSKVEWIRSRQYAKYRHTVPPRLEWLVDIGLLKKALRGRYAVTSEALRFYRDLETVIEKPRDKLDQAIFNYVAPSMLSLKHPSLNNEVEAMTCVYKVLSRSLGRVRLDVLCLASAYRLVAEGFKASSSSMSRVFGYLSLLYPDRVFATYSDDDSPEVSGLDISLVE